MSVPSRQGQAQTKPGRKQTQRHFLYAGVGHFHESRVCRNKPRPAQLAAIRRIVGDALWLIRRAPEDGAVQTTAQDFAQVLKRKRVSYTGEEVCR